ncbi:MAG: glycosyltransferase [Myxococcota bacterium]
MSGAPARLTLAICTFDRADSLLRTLDTAAGQVCDQPFEVLVVDNNSSDGTSAAVAERAESFPVPLRVLREERQGRSHALNLALEAAQGDVLIFTDDDVDLRTGFIAAHAAVYADPEVVGAGGRIVPVMPDNTPAWMRTMAEERNGGVAGRYEFGDEIRDILPSSGLLLPFGANMSVRRDAARAAQGFRLDLGWGATFVPGEENDLFERIRDERAKVVYQPAAVVHHRFQRDKATLAYFLRYEAGYGRAQVLMADPKRAERVRWIVRNALRLSTCSLELALGPGEITERIEPLRQRARARGRLAQLLCA